MSDNDTPRRWFERALKETHIDELGHAHARLIAHTRALIDNEHGNIPRTGRSQRVWLGPAIIAATTALIAIAGTVLIYQHTHRGTSQSTPPAASSPGTTRAETPAHNSQRSTANQPMRSGTPTNPAAAGHSSGTTDSIPTVGTKAQATCGTDVTRSVTTSGLTATLDASSRSVRLTNITTKTISGIDATGTNIYILNNAGIAIATTIVEAPLAPRTALMPGASATLPFFASGAKLCSAGTPRFVSNGRYPFVVRITVDNKIYYTPIWHITYGSTIDPTRLDNN
ncbi:MAG: hypothetical protein ACR2P2_15805 [Nakamurella sp.]